MRHTLLLFVAASCVWLRLAEALSSIYLYSGSTCSDPNADQIFPSAYGECTPVEVTFWSFQVGQLDPGCTVTVYGKDNLYCGLGYKYALKPDKCYGNDTQINQFTVDCPSMNVTAGAETPPSTSSSSHSGSMSTSRLIIIVFIAVIAAITLITITVFAWRWWRQRRFCPDLPSTKKLGRRKNKNSGLLIPDASELHDEDEKHPELEDQNWSRHEISSRDDLGLTQHNHRVPTELDSTVAPLRQLEAQELENAEPRTWINPQRWSWVRSNNGNESKRASWI